MDNSPKYDEERIGAIRIDIRTYIQDLANLNIRDIQDLHDKRNFYAASMILFSLLNRVFDLGSEVAVANNLGIPSTYREIFQVLENNGFIESALARQMIRLVIYRNLLSHEYYGITDEKLINLIRQMSTIEEFVSVMGGTIRESR